MDDQVREFIQRCDRLLAAAHNQRTQWEQEGDDYGVKAVTDLIAVVARLRDQAVNGTLRRPSKGMGWGMTKAVGEWGDRTELYDLAYELEDFYRTKM